MIMAASSMTWLSSSSSEASLSSSTGPLLDDSFILWFLLWLWFVFVVVTLLLVAASGVTGTGGIFLWELSN